MLLWNIVPVRSGPFPGLEFSTYWGKESLVLDFLKDRLLSLVRGQKGKESNYLLIKYKLCKIAPK